MLACVAQLAVLVARTTLLEFIAIIIVGTPALADAALQATAAGIGFVSDGIGAGAASVGDFAVAGVQTVAAVYVLCETVKFVLGTAMLAGAAGWADEVQTAWTATVEEVVADPWPYLADLDKFSETLGENFSGPEGVWLNSVDKFQGFLGAAGPSYDVVIGELIESASVFGWDDGATFHTESSIGDDIDRRSDFLGLMTDAGLGDRISVNALGIALREDVQPTDITDLLLGMGQIDVLGGADEAVIRVLTQPGAPPTFTLLIPSTQQWLPWDSQNPNDTIGDLMILQGSSALEGAAAEALDAAMKDYYEQNRDSIDWAGVSSAPVMVAGFSQGGITAAAFAEHRSDTYNIVQVLTAGAPMANFDIPDDVSVIAYESDPVSSFDGRANPAMWETITAGNGGGGGFGSHNALKYAHLADSPAGSPQKRNNLDLFLGLDEESDICDYYAIKEST